MKIVIPGGSGQVGQILARAFRAEGHDVVTLSRGVHAGTSGRTVLWDGRMLGPWAEEFDGADVVINLAGRSVNCRYTKANLDEIMNSRVESTRVVGEAIARAKSPPRVWLQASTATIYSHRFDAPNDDVTGIIGGQENGVPAYWKFSVDVARAWEQTAEDAKTPHTRKVMLRSAMVMSPDAGGIFDVMVGLVRRGLGGRAGDGRQFISWIHHIDFIRAIRLLIERNDLSGPFDCAQDRPINLASPNPLPNAEFMRQLREACGTRIGLPATRWMLEVGAVFLKTDTELVLKSRRVVPKRLLEAGFRFEFPDWNTAARDLARSHAALRLGK